MKIKIQFILIKIAIFLMAFFISGKCLAKNMSGIKPGDVIINEIMWMGSSISTADEWLELKNTSSHKINFNKNPWSLFKNDKLMIKIDKGEIKPDGYYLISNNSKNHKFSKGESILNIDPDLSNSSISLPNNNIQYKLYNFVPDDKVELNNSTVPIDIAGNKEANLTGENGKIKKSMERNDKAGDGTKLINWHTSCKAINIDFNSTDLATPKAKNSKEKDCPSNNNSDNNHTDNIHQRSSYINKVIINEIYPSPDTRAGETEFIEIKNISNKNINLKKWSASDSIHKGKPLKKNYILKPNKFYVFKGKFYLNSSDDSANVFDENGNLVDSLSYNKGESRHSYAFDGSAWRWTNQLTPGGKNKFDKILSGKIIKDKPIYKNIYSYFKVKSDKDAKKFTWNFGDGHKSYLKSTRHKYKKTGTYTASLKITGKGENAFYNFTVKVKKYKALKVRIKIIFPNPKGNDSKNEWISIENKSKKNINLKNWSIATGWKKLYNHPIRKNFKIKSDKIKTLTYNICAFTLNNTKAKIELRDPSGKAVQKIKYKQNKAVPENSFYQKINYHWRWFFPQKKSSPRTSKKVAGVNIIKYLHSTSPNSLTKNIPLSKKILLSASTPSLLSSPNKINLLSQKTSPLISLISPRNKLNSQLILLNAVSPIKIPPRFFQKSKQPTNLFLISANSSSLTHSKIIFYSFTKKISSEYWLIKFTHHFSRFLNLILNQLFWQL